MEIIAFITLSTGTKHKITQEEYNQICEASPEDFIQIGINTSFKKSAVMEINNISEWQEEKPYNYGQPYKALPVGIGFVGIITREKRMVALEGMAKGLKKAKTILNRPTPQIDEFLELARKRYKFIKQGIEPTNHLKV